MEYKCENKNANHLKIYGFKVLVEYNSIFEYRVSYTMYNNKNKNFKIKFFKVYGRIINRCRLITDEFGRG